MPRDRPLTAFGLSRAFRLAPPPRAGDIAEGSLLELAWDGHRVMACRAGDDVRMWSADFREWTGSFASIVIALRRLATKDFVLDGFLCALDERSRPSFELLKQHVGSKKSTQRVIFAAWDVMRAGGDDLRALPLSERRERLAALLRGGPETVVLSQELAGEVEAVASSVRGMGMRGIVGRARGAAYPPKEPWVCSSEVAWDRSLSAPPVVTNADKILFPRDNIPKKDMVGYYADIADIILPYMRDRPIVCQRWPDGIDDFTWYQHRVPPRAPDYLRAVWVEGNRRIVVENASALLWMANQAAITFHGFASRVSSLQSPDWIVIDLDPGERTTWEITIKVALALRQLLELLELPSVFKTSGQKGVHVLVPLAPDHTPQQAHEFGRRAALMISKLFPEDVSLDATTENRRGRLYIDTLQSFVGKSLVLPYSLRAADGAPVSCPLEWSEVSKKLRPRDFNLKTMRARIQAKGDLAAPLLSGAVKLGPVLAKMRV